ncbi:mannonate dehydratase [Bacillus horti]|uniref:Mannonate dehydratase n=1 Tax=Caldalkalibacillus horti TaxID=77523 RepID=A0ABT9VVI3_9BACI|nr:mannonate dehydratase [Bacillus horti]MDQ0164988.1 mannonate dehydratase [Bacillus horti]
MRMVFRWYGEGNDTVTLEQIKQIPGVEGIVWALHDKPAGEVWALEEIQKVKEQIGKHQFHIEVVESVNIHESIKLGSPERDTYIENYKKTIENLGAVGVKVICYNFMPVFDWTRTDLFKELEDGSTALFYEKAKVEGMDPMELVEKISQHSSLSLPGWEPERLKHLKSLFEAYRDVTEEQLWQNLGYFLQEVVPVAEKNGIVMAIHPDDPPWSIFGLPRIITNKENVKRVLKLVDSPSNGLTLCSGSLGANPANHIPEIIREINREFPGRIHFTHIRNVRIYDNGDFIETSHRTQDGSIDMCDVVKALHEDGFTGYTRPDHGRHIWNETCRPGYGLYDRALGIMYLWGVWDSLERERRKA